VAGRFLEPVERLVDELKSCRSQPKGSGPKGLQVERIVDETMLLRLSRLPFTVNSWSLFNL